VRELQERRRVFEVISKSNLICEPRESAQIDSRDFVFRFVHSV
jgi:hypothetical protein